MKKLLLGIILVSLSMNLLASAVFIDYEGLLNPMDTLYSFSNPIAGAFKRNFLDVETAYESSEATLTYLLGSIGVSTDIFSIYAAPVVTYPMAFFKALNEEESVESVPILIPAVASLKIANAIVISGSINAMYFDGEFGILSVPTVAVGLGGKSSTYRKYSAGALYYKTDDLFVFDENGKIKMNDNFNWKNGVAGVYAYTKTLDSESYLNLSIDLSIIDDLSNEESEDTLNDILNNLTGDFVFSISGGMFGLGWNRGSYYGLLGLDLKFLKIWAESFGGNGMEIIKNFLVKGKISF